MAEAKHSQLAARVGAKLAELLIAFAAAFASGALCGLIEGAYQLADSLTAPSGGAYGEAAGFFVLMPFVVAFDVLGGLIIGGFAGAAVGLIGGLALTLLNSLLPQARARWGLRASWFVVLVSAPLLLLLKPTSIEPLFLKARLITALPRHDQPPPAETPSATPPRRDPPTPSSASTCSPPMSPTPSGPLCPASTAWPRYRSAPATPLKRAPPHSSCSTKATSASR
jgi:hypothetical protein